MTVQLLYFAWVRERIGVDGEELTLPHTVSNPLELAHMLAARGGGYAEAFKTPEKLRCAVNQVIVPLDAPFCDPREIAFFPPVTGG